MSACREQALIFSSLVCIFLGFFLRKMLPLHYIDVSNEFKSFQKRTKQRSEIHYKTVFDKFELRTSVHKNITCSKGTGCTSVHTLVLKIVIYLEAFLVRKFLRSS